MTKKKAKKKLKSRQKRNFVIVPGFAEGNVVLMVTPKLKVKKKTALKSA